MAAHWLHDAEAARLLRPLIEPWSGLIVTGAGEIWGPTGDDYLAGLDIAEDDLEAAAHHLGAAYDLYQRNGGRSPH